MEKISEKIFYHDLYYLYPSESLQQFSKKEVLDLIMEHRDHQICMFCIIYQYSLIKTYLDKRDEKKQ